MDVHIIPKNDYKLTKEYLEKVQKLINYMYDTMLIMQPEMYIYTQKGIHWTQIQLIWRSYEAESYHMVNSTSQMIKVLMIKFFVLNICLIVW